MIYIHMQAWYVSPARQDSFILSLNCSCESQPALADLDSDQLNDTIEAALTQLVLQPIAEQVMLDDPANRIKAIWDFLQNNSEHFLPYTDFWVHNEGPLPVQMPMEDNAARWQLACVSTEAHSIHAALNSTAPVHTLPAPDAPDVCAPAGPHSNPPRKGLFQRLREKLQERRKAEWILPHIGNLQQDTSDMAAPPLHSKPLPQITQPMDLSQLSDSLESRERALEEVQEFKQHLEKKNQREKERERIRKLLTESRMQRDQVATAPHEPLPVDEAYAEQLRTQPSTSMDAEPLVGELPDDEELRSLFDDTERMEDEPRKQAPAPALYETTIAPELVDTVPTDLSDLMPAPLRTTDVQFSAAAPKAVNRGEAFLFEVLMYEEDYRDRIDEMIQRSIGDAAVSESGFYQLYAEQQVQVILESTDISFRETSPGYRWNGKLAKFTFMPVIPPHYSSEQVRLTATVVIDGIRLLDLKMLLHLSPQPQEVPVERCKTRSIFVCYAQKDTFEVHKRLQGILAIAPDVDIFIDWKRLRTGDAWRRRIKQEILVRDQFYLFWSRHARKSAAVNDEWRFALQHKGLQAIVPMPLDLPAKCPPPAELNDSHFCDWALAYGYAHQLAYRRRFFFWEYIKSRLS